MAGTFGYELDPQKLSEEEKEEIKKQILEYRKYADLIQEGLYYRLTNPFTENVGAWAFVSEDRTRVLFSAVAFLPHGNMPVQYIRFKGLREGCSYVDQASGQAYASDALMEAGIPLPEQSGEYRAYQMHFKKI